MVLKQNTPAEKLPRNLRQPQRLHPAVARHFTAATPYYAEAYT